MYQKKLIRSLLSMYLIELKNTLYLKILPQLVGAVPRLVTHPYLCII